MHYLPVKHMQAKGHSSIPLSWPGSVEVAATKGPCWCPHVHVLLLIRLANIWDLCAGFVRVAAEHGASLVPIAALGEVTGLRNAINIPWMQAWSYKRLGFPVPYLVVGR